MTQCESTFNEYELNCKSSLPKKKRRNINKYSIEIFEDKKADFSQVSVVPTIFNHHFHSIHDSRSVTRLDYVFGALKNSPSLPRIGMRIFLIAPLLCSPSSASFRCAIRDVASPRSDHCLRSLPRHDPENYTILKLRKEFLLGVWVYDLF